MSNSETNSTALRVAEGTDKTFREIVNFVYCSPIADQIVDEIMERKKIRYAVDRTYLHNMTPATGELVEDTYSQIKRGACVNKKEPFYSCPRIERRVNSEALIQNQTSPTLAQVRDWRESKQSKPKCREKPRRQRSRT